MANARITVSDALYEALDFTRSAWRDAWAPMGLTTIGWALLVVSAHASISDVEADVLQKVGFVLLVFHLPLLGALYRGALGGRPFRGLGPGGLQVGGVEGRFLVVNVVLLFFALLACTPMILLSGILYMILRRFDGVTLGPLGHWEWWFLVAGLFWVAFLVFLTWLAGRLAMATPLSIERRRILPWDSWDLTPGEGGAIARAFIAAHLPTAFVLLALTVFGWMQTGGAPTGLHGGWPLPETIVVGAMAGAALSVLQAPLSVGVIMLFYDELAPLDAVETPVEPPAPEQVLPILAELEPEPEPEHEPELEPELDHGPEPEADHEHPSEARVEPEAEPFHPEPEAPFSTVEYVPDGHRFAQISAPWLAHEPVPEAYASAFTGAPVEAEIPHEPESAGAVDEAEPHHDEAPVVAEADELHSAEEPHHEEPAPEFLKHAEEPPAESPHDEASPPHALDGAGEPEHPRP